MTSLWNSLDSFLRSSEMVKGEGVELSFEIEEEE
jgi:hypothetical protein